MKPVKYLVSGWTVIPQLNGKDVYKPFKRIIPEYNIAEGYLKIMECNNSVYSHIKVDKIECIWNED